MKTPKSLLVVLIDVLIYEFMRLFTPRAESATRATSVLTHQWHDTGSRDGSKHERVHVAVTPDAYRGLILGVVDGQNLAFKEAQ